MPQLTAPLPKDTDFLTSWLSGRRTASAKMLTPEEVEGFRRAQRLSFDCARAVAAEMRPGWTEAQTGQWMIGWLYDRGVKTMLHKPIAVFHERSIAPDGQWGPVTKGAGAILQDTDVVILDCAPVVEGYTGDVAYTVTVGHNPEVDKALDFLAQLRAEIPACFADPQRVRNVFEWVDDEIRAAGYGNAAAGYPENVLGHRVYHHGRLNDRLPWFLPERLVGYVLSWHSLGFLGTQIRRMIFPEVLGPKHRAPKTGIWAIEPHIRADGFGAKFEELLVVEQGKAYWLDDISQQRITIRP
ncbi:M24 family metallopeptidase [Nocardia altamirensis]|uniref:M24 family metallopeptidase n=1 Tax=Nocardia altamirensis TaxID=472158 RepID=UPI0008402E76|nr:M24 family metallopeptidase [Nocardia altamirensis]